MDKNQKNREQFRKMMPWVLPLAIIAVGIMEVFSTRTPLVSCVLIIASGMMFAPPVKAYLKKFLSKYLSLSIRLFCFFVLSILAIQIMRAENAVGQFKTAKHQALYIEMFENDLERALQGQETLIPANIWLNSLQTAGQANANTILKDFKKNEVKAAKTYQGAWLIKGKVRSIDNSFGSAIVGIGGQSEIFNFGAHLKNRDRAATYSLGQDVTFYCKTILETLTLISGRNCQDYNDWKSDAVSAVLKNPPDTLIDQETSLTFEQLIQTLRSAVNELADSSICFVNARTPQCASEIKKLLKL